MSAEVQALTLSHWLPTDHPIHSAIGMWAQSIEASSEGTLKIVINPAERLGRGPGHYEMVRSGTIDIGLCAPGYQMDRFPLITTIDQPFMIDHAKNGSLVFDQWYRPYAMREMADVFYCFAFLLGPGVIHSVRRVVLPSDLREMRLRPPNSTIRTLFQQLGATMPTISLIEMPSAVARGELDGVAVPWGGLCMFGFDKAFAHHIDVPLYTTAFVMALNRNVYQRMSSLQRRAIERNSNAAWAATFGSLWMEFEVWGRSQLEKKGDHDIYIPTASQTEEWQVVAGGVRREWRQRMAGANFESGQIWNELIAALRDGNARPASWRDNL